MKESSCAKTRVFLVDDHPIVREGVRSYLAGQPAIDVVGEASDAKEALQKARKLLPDVIVLDISLPSLDGGELARQLRRSVPRARLIAFSIHSGEAYVVRMARCGVHGYVMKDQPTAKLLEAVRQVARGGLAFPSDMADAILSPDADGPAGGKGDDGLTARQRDVLALIADGLVNKQIARRLNISARTAEAHRQRLSAKLKIRTVAGLTKYAIQRGLTSLK